MFVAAPTAPTILLPWYSLPLVLTLWVSPGRLLHIIRIIMIRKIFLERPSTAQGGNEGRSLRGLLKLWYSLEVVLALWFNRRRLLDMWRSLRALVKFWYSLAVVLDL